MSGAPIGSRSLRFTGWTASIGGRSPGDAPAPRPGVRVPAERRSGASRGALLAIVLAAIVLAAIAPASAAAQGGFYVGAGVGPAVGIDDWPTQLRVEEEIGFYVDEQPSGFFFAFTPSQSFGADYWALTFAARFGYMLDIYRGRDIGFQLGPTVTVPGIGLGSFFDSMRDVDVYFHFSVALAVRLLLDSGRIAVYVRPVDFEFGFGDGHLPLSDDSVARYVLVAGVQLHTF